VLASRRHCFTRTMQVSNPDDRCGLVKKNTAADGKNVAIRERLEGNFLLISLTSVRRPARILDERPVRCGRKGLSYNPVPQK